MENQITPYEFVAISYTAFFVSLLNSDNKKDIVDYAFIYMLSYYLLVVWICSWKMT